MKSGTQTQDKPLNQVPEIRQLSNGFTLVVYDTQLVATRGFLTIIDASGLTTVDEFTSLLEML